MHSLILGTNIKFILIRMPILPHIARGSKLRQKAACGGTAHYFPLFSLFPPQVNLFGLCQLWCQSSVLWKGMLWRGSLYYIKFKHSSCIILNLNTAPEKQGAEIWQDLLKGLVFSSDHPQIQNFCVDTHLPGLTVLNLWLLHLPHW